MAAERIHEPSFRGAVSAGLRRLFGLFAPGKPARPADIRTTGREAPLLPAAPTFSATPPSATAAPVTALKFQRVFTGRRNWLSTGHRQADGVAMLVMEEALDPARAVIAITPESHRQLCLIVAPDGKPIGVRADGLHAIALSAVPLQHRNSTIVRLQHPCTPSRYLGVTMPGQGGPHGLVIFDSLGHTELDSFDLVRIGEAEVPAAVRFIAYEFARVAAQPYSARGLMNALASGAVRPELAEALIRLLRPEESAVLARDLLERPKTLALLGEALPGNVWAQTVLPALAAWNRGRERVSLTGSIASPASDEFAGRPLEGHGMPQAGHVLTALARSHVKPRRTACVVTGMRNDGIYLLDFVSYHLSIGFEHVFIYTNDNTDGSDELLRALAAHGVITLIDNTIGPSLSPQQKYHAHALMLLPQLLDYRWAALVDSDEYVAFDTGMFRSIVDFITWQEAQAVDAIALCWVLYVAATGDVWRDESTIRRFPMRENSVNPHVKSLIRTNKFWHAHPHFPHTTMGRPFVFRTENGGIHHIHNATERLAAFAETPSADFAWINHYILRSAGEALMKLSRGRADQTGPAAGWQQRNLEFTARTFMSLSRSHGLMRDERILACAAGQAEVLARLMSLPGVAECHARIAAAMPGRLAESARSFLAAVSPEGQSEIVREFHAVIAQFAEGDAVA
jgi:hypothetical protein